MAYQMFETSFYALKTIPGSAGTLRYHRLSIDMNGPYTYIKLIKNIYSPTNAPEYAFYLLYCISIYIYN